MDRQFGASIQTTKASALRTTTLETLRTRMSHFTSSTGGDAFRKILEERNGTIALLESELEATVNALAAERVESFTSAHDENRSSSGNRPPSKASEGGSRNANMEREKAATTEAAAVSDVKQLEAQVKRLEEEKENLLLLYRTSEGKLQIRVKQVQEGEKERESVEKACAVRIEEYKDKVLAVDKQRKSVQSELELAITQLGEYRASCVEKDLQLKEKDRQLRALGHAEELRKEADRGLAEAHAAIATARQKMEESDFTARSRLRDCEEKIHFLEKRCKENDTKIDNLTKRNFFLETENYNLKMENTQYTIELDKALSINKTSIDFIGNNISSPLKPKAPLAGKGPLAEAGKKLAAQSMQMRAFTEGQGQPAKPLGAKSSPTKAAAPLLRVKEELQNDASFDFDDSLADSQLDARAAPKPPAPRGASKASAAAKPAAKAKAKRATYLANDIVGDPFITIKDGRSLKKAVLKK